MTARCNGIRRGSALWRCAITPRAWPSTDSPRCRPWGVMPSWSYWRRPLERRDHRNRPSGVQTEPPESGEAALYDDLGQRVILTRHGIVIEGAGLPVTLRNTPEVTLKASAKVRIEAPVLECTGQIIDQCNAGG